MLLFFERLRLPIFEGEGCIVAGSVVVVVVAGGVAVVGVGGRRFAAVFGEISSRSTHFCWS